MKLKKLKQISTKNQSKIKNFLFYWFISIIFSLLVASNLIFHPPVTFRSVSVILLGLSLTLGLVASVLILEIVKLIKKGFKEKNYLFLFVVFLVIVWLIMNFSKIRG